jgi:hypothetical protein
VRITIVVAVWKTDLEREAPYLARQLSGFSNTGSKSMSIVRRARMVSSGDDGVYTGSGLRGVISYVQCVAIVFPSQVCSLSDLQAGREREFVPKSRVVVYDCVKV